MSENNREKQSRRESTNTYVVNPDKSADPPQPQGKCHDIQQNRENNNKMK